MRHRVSMGSEKGQSMTPWRLVYGKRFIVRADEKLTAFLELESAARVSGQVLREN